MKKLLSIILFFILPLGIVLGQSPSHIYIKSDYMVLSGGTSAKPIYLVINNSDTNALVPNSGWIISENEFNMVLWNIGNSTGIYRVPFGLSTSAYLPLKLNISTAGIGSGGAIKFSTYHTAALNSGAEPSDVTNLTPFILSGSPSNTDNSYNVADRFYIIDANTGYSTKPTAGNITFSYISGSGPSSEIASPNILTESRLMAERFNSGSSTWSDWFGEGCSDAVASGVGTVQTGPVTASNFYRSWALWDNLMTLPLTISSTNIICYGSSTGSAMVTVSGGTAPYTYSWAPSGGTSATASSLSAGTYSVTVTDNTGCSGTASSTITQPATVLSVSALVKSSAICNGGSDSLFSTPSGGTTPYTYSWSPATSLSCSTCQNPVATPTTTTTYTITVTDNNSCTNSTSISITVNPIPTIAVTASPDSIFLYTLDTLFASGANTYLWNTGDTARKSFVSPATLTSYSVLGTSLAGCVGTSSINVIVKPTILSPSAGDTNINQAYSAFINGNDSTAFAGDTIEDSPANEFQRWYNFWEPRLGPTGSFKVGAESYGAYLQNLHTSGSTYCSGGTPISATWNELGINTHSQFSSGRVDCITFDPTNSSIMYAGGVSGGVYRSTDGGADWVNAGTDVQMLDLCTSDIAVEPLNHNTVYVASGDAQGRLLFSDGVYLTADANDGNTAVWTWEGPSNLSSNGQYIHQLFVDPLNTNFLYAAIDNPSGISSAGGIWQVTNRQSPPFSWVRNYSYSPWGFTYTNSSHNTYSSDAAFSVVGKTVSTYMGTQTRLYAAGYDIRETLPDGTWWSLTGPNSGTNGPGSGLDLSPDPSSTGFPFILNASYFKEPITGDPLYLLLINLTLSDDGDYLYANIFTSASDGNSYEFIARYNFTTFPQGWDISPNPLSTNTSTFPWTSNQLGGDLQGSGGIYASGRKALAIDPHYDNRIFVGTTVLNESTDGGVTWNEDYTYFAAVGPHDDYHAIKFQPGNSDLVYLGTDGGLSSFNSTTITQPTALTDLNSGLGLSLDYDATSSEQDPGDVFQTLQDDGANHLINNLYTTGVGNGLGDGQNNLIDYSNPNIAYVSCANCGTNGARWAPSINALVDNPTFTYSINYSRNGRTCPGDPTFLNPYDPNTMYEGRQEIQKANDVRSCIDLLGPNPTNWKQLSQFAIQIGGIGGFDGYVTQAMTISPTDSNYLYATLTPLTPGDYYRFAWSVNSSNIADGGGTGRTDWTDATPDNSNYAMSGVAVSYANPDKVWICYQGATDPTHTHFVKAGVYSGGSWTWTDDNTGLCYTNINCIVYENGSNDGLYVGTDAGVYYKNASMSSWERLGTSFPNVIVYSLSINYCAQKLIVGTYGRGAWETDLVHSTPTSSQILQITSDTHWKAIASRNVMMIPGDVEVQAPYTLTICSGLAVHMSKGHQIIVDPGATLVVNGTITNACGDLWSGIQLNGNITQDQTSAYQGTVILNSGSILENAVNGITTNSGIITANGATFYNNQRDIQFFEYINPYHPSINKCFFKNCSFQTDQNYIWLNTNTYPLESRVTMWNVHGVNFQGNIFINSIPISGANSISDIYFRGNGIGSIDASYSANNCSCMSTYPPGGCCGTGNTFEGLGYGIEAFNSNPSDNIQITGNSFIDNYFDIDIQNMNNAIITNNSFSKTAKDGDESTSDPYNIYLDQCTGYNVSGNTLSNTFYINTGGAGKSYGTVVYNSGPTNNLINNNDFSGIYVQSQSQGTNGQKGADIINIFPPRSYIPNSGLQYHCNQYTSSVASGADISVVSGLIDPMQGSCTNATTTANNTFNNACGSRLNISVYPTILWDIFYSTPTTTPHPPYCESTPVQLNPCVNVTTANCSPTYTVNIIGGSLLTSYSVDYHTTLRTQKKSFLTSKDSLTGILARGSTSGLYTIISTGTAATILDSLLAPGPYLSDSVLKTAILAGLPMETLADILIPNTPLDSSVVATLDGIGLPDTLASRLNEYQADSILSPRNILIAGIDYFQALMDYTDNALITALETDTNFVGTFDSAQAVLKSDTLTLPRLAQLASLQWAAGENTTALVTLDTIHRRDVDSIYNKFYELMPMLMTLSGDSNGYLSLKGKATDSTLLEQIAMDTLKPGYANARAVLEFVYNQLFDEPILPLVSGGTHRPNKNNNYYIIGKDQTVNSRTMSLKAFNLFPNPAKNEVTIQYSLNKNIQNAGIELYDELGNKTTMWQLPLSQTRITENTANLPAGIYIYSIFANNAVVQRGKLVIQR